MIVIYTFIFVVTEKKQNFRISRFLTKTAPKIKDWSNWQKQEMHTFLHSIGKANMRKLRIHWLVYKNGWSLSYSIIRIALKVKHILNVHKVTWKVSRSFKEPSRNCEWCFYSVEVGEGGWVSFVSGHCCLLPLPVNIQSSLQREAKVMQQLKMSTVLPSSRSYFKWTDTASISDTDISSSSLCNIYLVKYIQIN